MNSFLSGKIFCIWLVFFSNTILLLASLMPPQDPCDISVQRDPQALRSDKITVLINGYSETRITLLQSIVVKYAASSLVSSVLVLWGNPSTSHRILTELAHNLTGMSSFGAASISIVRQHSSSLNTRFLPRSSIDTQAVLICDDDIEVDAKSLGFAFQVWSSNPNRLIGLFARSHEIDLSSKEWIYTLHPDKYSIILTKFMLLRSEYLYKYSCGGGLHRVGMRRTVELQRNCEDILMNFIVADDTNAGPILVGAERVRDYGDPRNEDDGDAAGRHDLPGLRGKYKRKRVKEVGLSSRRAEHRKRRGLCIREFHKLMGRMPLRYSYGKLIDSVSEQGHCRKGGKLVLCDQ